MHIRRIVIVLVVGLLASLIGLAPKAPVAANPPDRGPSGLVSSVVLEGQGGPSARSNGLYHRAWAGGEIAPCKNTVHIGG